MTTLTRCWRLFAQTVVILALLAGMMHPVAAQEATPASAGHAETIWVDAALSAGHMPTGGRQTLIVARIVWDAGAGYRSQETTPGLGINCVLDGQWAFQPDRDELVSRAGAAPVPAPAGEETTLAIGDCAILHVDVARDERNPGTEPLVFLVIALLPDESPPPPDVPGLLEAAPVGYLYSGNWSGTPEGPDRPRQVALRQLTLAPGAEAPMLTVNGDALLMVSEGTLGLTPTGGEPLVERAVSFTSLPPSPVAAGAETELESGDSAHVQDGTTATLRNAGDGPATYWLLTLQPIGGEATPET